MLCRRYWLAPTGERLDYDPNAHKYSWVENWSEEHKRPFYYNQKTKESTWCARIVCPECQWYRATWIDSASMLS